MLSRRVGLWFRGQVQPRITRDPSCEVSVVLACFLFHGKNTEVSRGGEMPWSELGSGRSIMQWRARHGDTGTGVPETSAPERGQQYHCLNWEVLLLLSTLKSPHYPTFTPHVSRVQSSAYNMDRNLSSFSVFSRQEAGWYNVVKILERANEEVCVCVDRGGEI